MACQTAQERGLKVIVDAAPRTELLAAPRASEPDAIILGLTCRPSEGTPC
jgi:hypothetical protein